MQRKRLDVFPYLLLVPSLILLLGITLYPFITSIYYSFFDYSFTRPDVKFIGLKNYLSILEDGKFFTSLIFTCIWTVVNLFTIVLLGFATAVLMRQNFVGKGILKATMLIPWILPQVVTGYVFSLMTAQNIGIINRILFLCGVVPGDFSWFENGTTALIAIVMANSWRGFPFVALMLYSKMQSVPASYLEAAQLDGANAIQRFRYIMLPYIKMVLMTCCFLTFLWTFNAFDIVKVMTNGGPLEQTVTLSFLLQREAFKYMEIGKACAMAILMFTALGLIILGVLFIRLLIRKVGRQCRIKQ